MCPLWMLQQLGLVKQASFNYFSSPAAVHVTESHWPLSFEEFRPTASRRASTACVVKEEIDSIIQR